MRVPVLALVSVIPILACLAAPAAAQSRDWTGFYAGTNLGYDGDTGIVSLHAGYDRDLYAFVLGAELEAGETDIRAPGGGRVDQIYRLKLRAGRDLGDTMVYGVAGVAHASGRGADETGYLVGLGVEHRLDSHISIGAELLQHGFGEYGNTGRSLDVQTLSARVSWRF